MEDLMFCDQCQETCGNKGCTATGRCGKTAEVSNLQDVLVINLMAVATALEKRVNITREYSRFICRAMTATLTNTNFNPDRIYVLIDEARRYLKMLDAAVPEEEHLFTGDDADVISLRKTLLYGLKGICAYAFHAMALGYEESSIYSFVIKSLAAIARPETARERLSMLLLECGRTAMMSMALLDEANTETYGHPTITRFSCQVGTNPGILMSGHDLKDLEELLIQTENTGVDVYTHGEMLPAQGYPFFRKFAHFKGNYGGAWHQQTKDFAAFKGAIIVNSNCITPVMEEYADRIFTTGMAGYPGIPHILHRHIGFQKDFSPVIALAKKLPAPEPQQQDELICGFGHHQICSVLPQILHYVRSGSIRRFVVIAGCDGRDASRDYYTKLVKALPDDTIILTAGCLKYRFAGLDLGKVNGIPRILDVGQCNDAYSLIRIALSLQESLGALSPNGIPLSIVLGWYEQKAVAVLLSLLTLGFKDIRLGPTLPAFCSPRLLNVLTSDYGLKFIGDPEQDAADIMNGK